MTYQASMCNHCLNYFMIIINEPFMIIKVIVIDMTKKKYLKKLNFDYENFYFYYNFIIITSKCPFSPKI